MISVEEAGARVLSQFNLLEAETVSVFDSLGRYLAASVRAPFSIPPLDNSAMDGYAVRAADVASAGDSAPAELRVIERLAAGYAAAKTVAPGTAIRIMTGAPIPPGADAVVPFEDTDEGRAGRSPQAGDTMRVFVAGPSGANIRRAGEDVVEGQLVFSSGTLVRPSVLGVLASLGHKDVSARRRPRVGVLATGDELLEFGEPMRPGKIYNSNSYSVGALVRKYGGEPVMLGIARDTEHDLVAKLREALAQKVDMIVTSGGVSKGDFDVVKDVLAAEGAMEFWQVAQRPGKPMAFGSIQGVPLLGLPGNPVSSMVVFELYGRPALLKMQGAPDWEKPSIQAALVEGFKHKGGYRHHLRVVVRPRDGGFVASLTGEQGSGILTSMALANGLAVVPEDKLVVLPGEAVKVLMLDWPEWT